VALIKEQPLISRQIGFYNRFSLSIKKHIRFAVSGVKAAAKTGKTDEIPHNFSKQQTAVTKSGH